MDLTKQNILVTGGSQGIGRGAALELARAGADVAVNYRSNQKEAESIADEIRSLGRNVLLVQGDVSEQQAVQKMVDDVVDEWGEINGLVSNAAFSDRQTMVEADMDGFRKTIDVSMWGAFYAVQAVSKQFIKQGTGGAITVVSSPHAKIAIPTAMAYNMAKAAIDHMARTAAIEMAKHRVRVNVVHPGWIDTPGERKFFSEEQLEAGAKDIPWKRMGQPEEIGKLISFMMSNDCDYMTGSTVLMDGGISLPWWSNREDGKQ